MDSGELRKIFLDFFKERGHTIVPSSSLIPDDPSVLLTTAGMQQFKPYFMGKADPNKDFGARRTASIQKAFRTSDIDEVGDETHLTFFEMMGHFSFGDYFKKETIEWTYELLTKVFKISAKRISATVFKGDEKIPFDEESYNAWLKFISEDKIGKGGREDNVWGPAGPEGPCGAANEVYVDDMEVATLVFMEYDQAIDGTLTPLPQKGVDVGWGFERLAMILQDKKNIFETDLFQPIFDFLDEGSMPVRSKRIIADHGRGAIFLIADGVYPSNKERGYILRRLIRRAAAHTKRMQFFKEIPPGETFGRWFSFSDIANFIIAQYMKYPEYAYLSGKKENILNTVKAELEQFSKSFERGEKLLEKLILEARTNASKLTGASIFELTSTHGIPLEWVKDVTTIQVIDIDLDGYYEAQRRHQEISRAGREKKFGGHGLILNTGELRAANEKEVRIVTRLHTVTHLLQAALRKVLGPEIRQMGSDITAERTRFDFLSPRKLTGEEIKAVENLVNDVIAKDYSVIMEEMAYADAIKSGALFFFREKYPEQVSIYSVVSYDGEVFSKELCGGPHVLKTSEIGKFRIIKEETVGAGVRRIRATVE